MKAVMGITVVLLGPVAWAQSDDSQMTPRQLFDYGMKAPAAKPAVKPKPTTNFPATNPKPPNVPKPSEVTTTPEKPLVGRTTKAPDGETPVQMASYAPLALKYSILQ
ncbi:MAG TPA: hypothetical protein VFE06_12115, partial [Acidobacteriaceae bacterium]|nr:hypothetical protein [Acidobacteriaceae bacterium]